MFSFRGTSHPYECPQCGLRFDRKSQLGYHIERNHQQVIRHSCPICKKGFYRSSDCKVGKVAYKLLLIMLPFQVHISSHSDSKKHSCETCGKGFSHVSNLNRHKRVHTHEKPYVCTECGKRFNQTSTLQNHQKIHTANVFGQCPECPKKFKTGRVLLKHLRSAHLYSQGLFLQYINNILFKLINLFSPESLTKVTNNSILFSYKKYANMMAPKTEEKVSTKCFYCEVTTYYHYVY